MQSRMVPIKVKKLNSFWEKSKGLIGADPIYPVMFETRWGIHTFGVKHPIDVLILDNSHRVVAMKKYLLPNRFFFWNPEYFITIELPEGEIVKRAIKIENRISPVVIL